MVIMTSPRLFGKKCPLHKKSPATQRIAFSMETQDTNDLEIIRIYETDTAFIGLLDLSQARAGVQQTYQANIHCDVRHENKKLKPVKFYLLCDDERVVNAQQKLGTNGATLIRSEREIKSIISLAPIVYESIDYAKTCAAKLLMTAEGRERLLVDADLRSMISAKHANLYLGFYIQTLEGRDFLAKADDIRSLLGSFFINNTPGVWGEQLSRQSDLKPAAYYLVSTEDGRKILRDDPSLFKKISEEYKRELNNEDNVSHLQYR